MKPLLFIISASLLLFFSACSAFPPKEAQMENSLGGKIHGHADITKGEIAPAALFEKLQKGETFMLLDVREAYEFEETHIPGTAARISVKELSEEKLKEAGIKKDDEIIVYCRSGNRSRTAAKLMRELGYTNVWDLNSGIIHWMEDGFPTESGTQLNSPSAQTLSQNEATNPKIGFDRLSHDFGEVPQFGGNVETTFTVKNTGGNELRIGELTTSCSCTTAKIEKTVIFPGGETLLKVTFNPNLHEEPTEKFKRTVFIPTNNPEKPEAELTIEVDILEGK